MLTCPQKSPQSNFYILGSVASMALISHSQMTTSCLLCTFQQQNVPVLNRNGMGLTPEARQFGLDNVGRGTYTSL